MLISLLKDLLRSSGRRPRRTSDEPFRHTTQGESASHSEFTHALLKDFFVLAHQNVPDNYDYVRYSFDGIDRSNMIDADRHAAYLKFFFDHAGEFFAACRLLQDAESRELYRRVVLYRMLGHIHVAIRAGVGWANESAFYDRAKAYDAGESQLNIDGILGRIRHHSGVPASGGSISLDCWGANVVYTVLKRQYYLSRGDIVIGPKAGDIVIDAGACFGDTAVYFADTVGKGGHVYAFDPLSVHKSAIDFNVAQNNLQDQVTIVQLAVGDKTSGARLQDVQPEHPVAGFAQPGFSLLGAAGAGIPITSIDDYVREQNLSRVDFIKMDIEGFELPALAGAERVIDQFRPRLAISLYHRPEDIFEIPLWIGNRFPWYSLHLDHYTIHHEETVLFAWPRVRADEVIA